MIKHTYVREPFYWELELTTPKHGDRPFHIGHVYHTKLNIELVSSQIKVNLGYSWAAFLIDGYSRRILSIYLTFEPPNYRSCMMVLKECFQRHGRLPDILMVDKGKEFNNICFDELLAAFSCTKEIRPTAKLRFSLMCERLFGLAGAYLPDNFQGNTKVHSNAVSINTNLDKVNSEAWTLGDLYKNLCAWAYEFYDNREHPALGKSPREVFNESVLPNKRITYDYDSKLCIFSLSTTESGVATIILNRGFKINYLYYWHYFFRNADIEHTQVPIRYDPCNLGIAYTYVKGQWLTCISDYYSNFNGRSERLIMLISEVLRARYKNESKKFIVTASRLAKYMDDAGQDEHIVLERIRDLEVKKLLSLIESSRDYQYTNLAFLISPDVKDSEHEGLDDEIKPYEEFW